MFISSCHRLQFFLFFFFSPINSTVSFLLFFFTILSFFLSPKFSFCKYFTVIYYYIVSNHSFFPLFFFSPIIKLLYFHGYIWFIKFRGKKCSYGEKTWWECYMFIKRTFWGKKSHDTMAGTQPVLGTFLKS